MIDEWLQSVVLGVCDAAGRVDNHGQLLRVNDVLKVGADRCLA